MTSLQFIAKEGVFKIKLRVIHYGGLSHIGFGIISKNYKDKQSGGKINDKGSLGYWTTSNQQGCLWVDG